MPIDHISDTARWVAIYRAMESDRPDAIFRDPFARRLAGEIGQRIVDTIPARDQMAWAIIVRTALIDEVVMAAVRDGTDLVVNLAAGLDTRPWRLALPPSVHWVDVDLPGILDHKTAAMAGVPTTCRYDAIRLDLTDIARRQALFAQLASTSRRALIITEGLLIYLSEAQVAGLATDLHAHPAFRSWAFDLLSPELLNTLKRRRGASFANAAFQFAPKQGTAFFTPFGWREAQYRSFWSESKRLKREMQIPWLWRLFLRFSTRRQRERMNRMSGIVVVTRDADRKTA